MVTVQPCGGITARLDDQALQKGGTMKKVIYLDNAATTKVRPEVVEAMLPFYTEYYGNPSAVYEFSTPCKEALAKARETVANSLGAKDNEIYFTNGGSESDNWALIATAEAYASKGKHLRAATKALRWSEMSRVENVSANVPDSIFVKSDYKLIQIQLKDILYIEGLKDYIRIQTEDQEGGILTLMSMKSIEDHLPGDIFIRVHRSYIVNINKIKTIERNRIVFGKLYIPISDSYKERFMELLDKRAIN